MDEGLSVVVCTLNPGARVARFLVPLRAMLQKLAIPTQLVVVDDGSSQATLDRVRELGQDVTVVQHDRNRGLPASRNSGVLVARYDWLLFCDDDLVIDTETVETFWKNRSRNSCLVPEIRGPEGKIQNSATAGWRRLDWKIESHEVARDVVAYPVGACFFISAATLRAAGGFDERYHLYYEDTDFGMALTRVGVRIHMLQGVTVVHHSHGADASAERLQAVRRQIYMDRWRFAFTALRGLTRVVVVGLGLPRTIAQAGRIRTWDPVRGYLDAAKLAPVLVRGRASYDLRSRIAERASASQMSD